MAVPAYIEERIRRAPPEGHYIVPQSTPVVAFGDTRSAHVATLGLNPSRREFYDKRGNLLRGKLRRLATFEALGVSDLTSASHRTIETVYDECNDYFDKNPYREWFCRLTPVIEACDGSYKKRTACHLDLVQWATDPTWNGLLRKDKKAAIDMIAADAEFLAHQLRSENIKILLVNGKSVWEVLRRYFSNRLVFEEVASIMGTTPSPCRLFCGTVPGGVRVIAWSVNRQSSFGVRSEFDDALAERVKGILRL